jgi:hypothetical protein
MSFDELVANLVWSATWPHRKRSEAAHRAHQAARRKLAFLYGAELWVLEAAAPMRVIRQRLMQDSERRLWAMLTRQSGWSGSEHRQVLVREALPTSH